MIKLNIYDFVGKETLTKEYKEFRLNNIYKYFTEYEIKSWLLNKNLLNISKFNKMILNQIQTYIFNYLPKYIGNFSNAEINGELYFGINDDGYIDGIPYYGDIDVNIIKKYILKINKYNHIVNNDHNIKTYYDNIDINIIKINNINNNEYIKFYDKFNKFVEKQDILKNKFDEYKYEYDKWQELRILYTGKLSNYINNIDIRKDIVNYITSKLHIYNNKEQNLILKCIQRWKSEEIFDTKIYIDDIIYITNDLSHPLKWLIDYKLLKLEELKNIKPKIPTELPDIYAYIKYCNDINNIRYRFENENNNFSYYIIRIDIKCVPDSLIIYKKPNSDKWVSKRRFYYEYNGPSCR